MENNIENFDYTITHVGDLKFEAELPNGELKECGDNLLNILKYTYFDNIEHPPIGWSTTREQLMKDYLPKLISEILNSKIPNEN